MTGVVAEDEGCVIYHAKFDPEAGAETHSRQKRDAAYLAALDPATMLQLLDVVDAAQACVDSVKSEWCGRVADEFGGHEDDWATWWDDSKAVAMFTALRRLKGQV